MDRIKWLLRNPELKGITIKFAVALILVVTSIWVVNEINIKNLNSKMIDENAAIVMELSKNHSVEIQDIVDKFYNKSNEEQILKGRKILEEYSYDENLDVNKNALMVDYRRESFINMLIPISVILVIGYVLVFVDLSKIYSRLREIIVKSDDMTQGKYYKIHEENEEGEFSILVNSLNNMGERIENTVNIIENDKIYLKDYLSDISHQIKTPLASLIMLNEIMLNDSHMEQGQRDKFLIKSKEQLDRMEWLVLNLLKMGRLEGSIIEFNMESHKIIDIVKLAISPLDVISKSKNQTLVVNGDIDREINCDREWLAEAISNIVKNGMEHAPVNGFVEIQIEAGKLIDKIYIRDNGEGMDQEVRKNIFRRFYRGGKGKSPNNIGIGLSLSKAIIEKMNGEIKVNSEKGRGTEFVISFIKV